MEWRKDRREGQGMEWKGNGLEVRGRKAKGKRGLRRGRGKCDWGEGVGNGR